MCKVLNECEAEETSSESKMDSEGDEDSEEMETEERYTGEEKDNPDSHEENHIPTSICLALTSQNVEKLEARMEVNTVMNVDVDAPTSLDTLINHPDEPTLSPRSEFPLVLCLAQPEAVSQAKPGQVDGFMTALAWPGKGVSGREFFI